MDKTPIEFYFDFSSPFAYLTSTWLEEVAEEYGRSVLWRPMMLGVAFKETGMKPLFHQPLRGEYGRHDFMRSARLLGLQVVVPEEFPYMALKVSRAFYWLEMHHSEHAVPFAKAAFEYYFLQGKAPVGDDDLIYLAGRIGVDADKLIAGANDPAIKQCLKDVTGQAIERGVFGAPYVLIDDEPFWGNDRRHQIEEWLKTGGW